MPHPEPFGPFRDGIDPAERTAQLRSLRTLVRCHFPLPELERALCEAETDCARLLPALALLEAVPSLRRRKILATFAYLHRPPYTRRRKGSTVPATEGNAHVDVD